MHVTPTALQPSQAPSPGRGSLADQVEQMFLEEMLKHCGPGALSGSFGGGPGEAQFASFLTREHAALLAGRLDLGIAARLDSAQARPPHGAPSDQVRAAG